jgi:hypothetical protein
MTPTVWAAWILSWLLREGDGQALLGDLAEEHARGLVSRRPRDASRRYRHEVFVSLAAVLRLRAWEFARSVPWGIVMGAYVLVAVLEIIARLVLARVWPQAATPASVVRLVIEFPGIALIAYLAARFDRAAAFVLGAMMLIVAALLSVFGSEETSRTYLVAFLTVGPLAAVLGGTLHRPSRMNP